MNLLTEMILINRKPARKIKPKVKGYRGKEPFLKIGEMIPWDSFLERDYIRLADFDLEVNMIYAQDEKITYLYNGKVRNHFPDFKVITNDNQVWIVEVKPNAFVNDEENQKKYLAGRAFCEERGWTYIVVTEDDIRPGFLQQNLSLLRGLGAEDVSDETLDFVKMQLEKSNECTIGHLRMFCMNLSEEDYYASVYQLIYFQELYCDLILQPITNDSVIKIKE
ncbi:TnsA endonuclease N-terminal domain-containing protein [Paenibacillus sp. DR312]|uniref:TnsA endonuclease N-terminal domain-containing protein n=1 Tax=Paenibacillus sp. DR312 TaxID=2871175 RepID=UPI001C95CA01|nr:TnsA endonuclease N-terminal domain-containing protein [Paenibacillus sp. DR312]QZN77682.1 TnsA endonuclease N-terminal domain-containing protein [Paenibacillus sp. DR312]